VVSLLLTRPPFLCAAIPKHVSLPRGQGCPSITIPKLSEDRPMWPNERYVHWLVRLWSFSLVSRVKKASVGRMRIPWYSRSLWRCSSLETMYSALAAGAQVKTRSSAGSSRITWIHGQRRTRKATARKARRNSSTSSSEYPYRRSRG